MAKLKTCRHLRALERDLRQAGIPLKYEGPNWWQGGKGTWLMFACTLDRQATRLAYQLIEPRYHAYDGKVAGHEAGFICRSCDSAIMGAHPTYKQTPLWPPENQRSPQPRLGERALGRRNRIYRPKEAERPPFYETRRTIRALSVEWIEPYEYTLLEIDKAGRTWLLYGDDSLLIHAGAEADRQITTLRTQLVEACQKQLFVFSDKEASQLPAPGHIRWRAETYSQPYLFERPLADIQQPTHPDHQLWKLAEGLLQRILHWHAEQLELKRLRQRLVDLLAAHSRRHFS